jgi:TonB family protein
LYGIYGKVYIEFVVEKDGNLSPFIVKYSPHDLLSQEALRICNLLPKKWKPGGHTTPNGKVYTKCRMVLPIKFENQSNVNYSPILPSFPKGEKKMKSFIKLVQHYPDSANLKGIEGKVYLQFTIGKTGELSNFKTLRSPDSLLSQEAIRIMKIMPNWKPGINFNGDSVDMRMVIPFNFKINREEVFQVVKTQPAFPGGDNKLFEYLGKNIKFPQSYREKGINGKLYFEFVVEKDGSISNLKIIKNENPELYKNIALAFNDMPKWKPGKQNGRPVRVKMVSGFSCIYLR